MPGGDAVVPADPFEQHLGGAWSGEAAGELLTVVRQHLFGHPMPCEGLGERGADGTGRGPGDKGGDDDEPGVVIDPADQLQLPSVDEHHPAHDVELP